MKHAWARLFLLKEAIRYLLSGSQRPFTSVLLERVLDRHAGARHRSIALTHIVAEGIRSHDYAAVFLVLKRHWNELPWKALSPTLVRRIFEVAVIFREPAVARGAFRFLAAEKDISGADVESMRILLAWCEGDAVDYAALDLAKTYFAAYPAHDEWFKGVTCADVGRPAEAEVHFRRCLELAPPEARELREDVAQRLRERAMC